MIFLIHLGIELSKIVESYFRLVILYPCQVLFPCFNFVRNNLFICECFGSVFPLISSCFSDTWLRIFCYSYVSYARCPVKIFSVLVKPFIDLQLFAIILLTIIFLNKNWRSFRQPPCDSCFYEAFRLLTFCALM